MTTTTALIKSIPRGPDGRLDTKSAEWRHYKSLMAERGRTAREQQLRAEILTKIQEIQRDFAGVLR